jgi:ATP synthase protein I
VNLLTSHRELDAVNQESSTKQVTSAVNDGWMKGGSFLNSVLAGTLVGYLLDMWLGTEPWLVVTGIVLGSYSGFLRIWHYLKDQDSN